MAASQTTRMNMVGLALATLVFQGVSLSAQLSAQEQPVGVRGVVVHSLTGEPVAEAMLEVGIRVAAETGSDGSFVLTALPMPVELVRVRKIGFEPAEHSIDARDGSRWIELDTIRLTPVSAELPEVVVRGQPTLRGEMAGFARRAEKGIGTFITRRDIETRRYRRSSEILRRIPGIIIECRTGQCLVGFTRNRRPSILEADPVRVGSGGRGEGLGADAPNEGLSHVATRTSPGEICPVTYYLDGMRFEGSLGIDELLPEEIEAIEVYKGPATTPMRFRGRGSTCGTIVIWSRAAN